MIYTSRSICFIIYHSYPGEKPGPCLTSSHRSHNISGRRQTPENAYAVVIRSVVAQGKSILHYTVTFVRVMLLRRSRAVYESRKEEGKRRMTACLIKILTDVAYVSM